MSRTRLNAGTRRIVAGSAVLALGLGGAMIGAVPASALPMTFQVTLPGDNAATVGTLRWALTEANANADADVIQITYTGIIPIGASALPPITDDVTVTGPGSGQLILNTLGTAFDVTVDATTTITGLTINAADGAVRAVGGDLTVSDVVTGAGGTVAIDFAANSADDDVAISDVTVNDGSSHGVSIDLGGGSATLTNITVQNRQGDGVLVTTGSTGTITATGIHSSANDGAGINMSVAGGNATIADVTAPNNGGPGFAFSLSGTATLNGSALKADNNDLAGFVLAAEDDSKINLTGTTSTANTLMGYLVPVVDAGASVIVSNSEATHNDEGGFLIGLPTTVGGPGGPPPLTPGVEGTVRITETRILHNDAGGTVPFTGIIAYMVGNGSLIVERTTVADNGGPSSGGSGIFLFLGDTSSAEVTASTISGNEGILFAGITGILGLTGDGTDTSSVTITNSTITDNTATAFVLVFGAGNSEVTGNSVTIANSTITDNTGAGAGGDGPIGFTGVTVDVSNSIFAGNGAAEVAVDYSAVTINHTLIQSPTASIAAAIAAGTGNLTGRDPQLLPLADNGGSTLTRLPADTSPVVGAGDPAFSGLATDQRGAPRVVGVLDMGAVELEPTLAATGTDVWGSLGLAALLLLAGAGIVASRRRARRV